MSNSIPTELIQDRYWGALIFLFSKHPKLKQVFTTKYFDLTNHTVKTQSLKKVAIPWSSSEKVMLNLALHLFNERNKFNLSDIDYLDSNNRTLAFEAMKIRFRNY